MRKLVLAIISVICLDLAFIIYPGFERKAEHVLPIARQTVTFGPLQASDPNGQNIDEPIPPFPAKAMSPEELASHRPLLGRELRRDARVSKYVRRPLENGRFKTVVIEYKPDRAGSLNAFNGKTRPDGIKAIAVRPEERSFFAKMVPVIRKPYDWVKYLGAKMRRM
jgi:hypothetical protein